MTKARTAHCALPDLGGVLPDAAGEDQGVHAAHGGGHGRDRPAEPVQVDIAGKLGLGVAGGGPGQDLAHVGGPGEPVQAGPVFQGRGQFG
jgi:hypothetical protein